MAFNYDEKYISIQVDGEEIKKIIFDNNLIGKTIPIETEYGYNLIEIGDEKVRVIEADCPDQLDVKQGYISKVGEVIVCLPNRLVIEIKGVEMEEYRLYKPLEGERMKGIKRLIFLSLLVSIGLALSHY